MLVDTSVWVDHLRFGNRALTGHLQDGVVRLHPFVIGELACGRLRKRVAILSWLSRLPTVPLADHDEVLSLIETHTLMGLGIGWIDMHLLASARLAGLPLWTLDRRLAAAARRVGVA